jgi:hypothetical protein
MSHEFERGAKEHFRDGHACRTTHRRGCVGSAAVPGPDTLIEYMSNDEASDRSPDVPGYQQTDQSPKKFAFPSHSR